MSYIGTFNPSDVTLALNDFIVTDFAEGTFIELIQNTKTYTQVRGIRGKHSRRHNRDKSGTLVFRLMQTSQDNEILSKLALEDDIQMSGKLFVVIKDNGGQSGFQLIDAYLEGVPDISYRGNTTTPREWRIYYNSYALYNVSGNKLPPIDITSGIF